MKASTPVQTLLDSFREHPSNAVLRASRYPPAANSDLEKLAREADRKRETP